MQKHTDSGNAGIIQAHHDHVATTQPEAYGLLTGMMGQGKVPLQIYMDLLMDGQPIEQAEGYYLAMLHLYLNPN